MGFNKINCFKSPERILEKPHEVNNTQFVVSGFDFLDADLKTSLCFGFPQNRKSISFEYKLHKMTNVAGRPKGSDKYNSLRQPPTAEMLAEFQNLLKQGYIIREVLASKEIYILFERPKQ